MALDEQDLMEAQDLISRASQDDLRIIAQAFKERSSALRRIAARGAMAKVEIGSTGRYSSNVKPQYLVGRRVEVTEIRQTKIKVKLLDGPVGKFRTGIIISSPASFIWDEKEND
jgi:hypothetical protein